MRLNCQMSSPTPWKGPSRAVRSRLSCQEIVGRQHWAASAELQGRTNVFWFDAHGDFNTPETTTSGFLDGMVPLTVTGRCWQNLSRDIPGFAAISQQNVTAIGVRDLDEEEALAFHGSAIRQVSVPTLGQELSTVLAERGLAGETAYLHVDLDVLDPRRGMNQFSTRAQLA